MSQEIWVYAEQKNGELLESSAEVISEGRRLADQSKAELGVLLLGRRLEGIASTLGRYGADTVYLAEDESWDLGQPEAFTDVLCGLITEHGSAMVLFAATRAGEDLAARVAARLRAGLGSGCDRLQLTPDGVLQLTYLCYQNKVHMTVAYPDSRPQMATIRPGAVKVKTAQNGPPPTLERVDPAAFAAARNDRSTVVRRIKADPKTIDITEAERVVAGGRGVGCGDGFELIAELAGVLGASVAGSRMAVDDGCIGRERQVGQSGKTVSPELMISCGISGASAHTIGLRESRTIIAINKDRNAPMVKIADLGVVGDFHEVAPVLIKQLKPIVSADPDKAAAENKS